VDAHIYLAVRDLTSFFALLNNDQADRTCRASRELLLYLRPCPRPACLLAVLQELKT